MGAEATPSFAAAVPMGFSTMGGLFRNRLFILQLAVMVCAVAVLAVIAGAATGAASAGWVAVAGAVCSALFAAFSRQRYREIARLAAEMDEVLHGGRRVTFTDCREGDVAILRSEVSKMVARLARTSEQIKAEKTALADALADISHQIRTPLTAMSLLVPVAERADDEAARRRALRELEGMVERVSWLVTALLKLARIDAGVMAFESRPVRVADVAARALAPLELSLDIHGVAWSMDVGDAMFTGDAAWTAEALENIVKNCAEATGEDGTVRIEAKEDALSTRICVSDDGPGIAAEDLPHVFERFYRGSRAEAPACAETLGGEADRSGDAAAASAAVGDSDPVNPQGFGIGLSLAQALVSAQGGSLRARNLAEGGACFEIAFPKMNV